MGIDLKDRVALITGAGGGLGRSHALLFAKLGAKVVVNDLGGSFDGSGQSTSMADETVKLIQSKGGQAVTDYSSGDKMEGAEKMVQTALSAFGKLDIIVNNAGILRDVSFKKQTQDDWDRVFAVHANGSRNVTKAAWEHMNNQKYGRIVMTTSAAGLYGNFGQSNYSAAKLAILGLALTLEEEGAKNNIKVNTIAPIARSRMTETVLPPNILEKLNPEYVSPVVAYFASEACAVSGQCWSVGAGYVARVAIVEALGNYFPHDKGFTPDDIAAKLDAITKLEGAETFANVMAEVPRVMKNVKM